MGGRSCVFETRGIDSKPKLQKVTPYTVWVPLCTGYLSRVSWAISGQYPLHIKSIMTSMKWHLCPSLTRKQCSKVAVQLQYVSVNANTHFVEANVKLKDFSSISSIYFKNNGRILNIEANNSAPYPLDHGCVTLCLHFVVCILCLHLLCIKCLHKAWDWSLSKLRCLSQYTSRRK